jgi:hypothetical protein
MYLGSEFESLATLMPRSDTLVQRDGIFIVHRPLYGAGQKATSAGSDRNYKIPCKALALPT